MTVAERIDISGEEAEALLARVKDVLPDEDYRIIKGLIDTHLLLNQAVSEKSTSIKRLLKMIFGSKTEKGKNGGNSTGRKKTDKKEKKAKGHGRNGADTYTGAETVAINHQTLHHCDPCPACEDGRLYRQPCPGGSRSHQGGRPPVGHGVRAGEAALQHLRQDLYGRFAA